jgi:hypothetical protein
MEDKNILLHAYDIVYNRGEEKERQYGDFFENMEDAAKIASVMSKKELTAEDIYHALIGLKFARESNNHKHDNILDALAYIASLHEYKESKFERLTEELLNNIDVVFDDESELARSCREGSVWMDGGSGYWVSDITASHINVRNNDVKD